MPLECILPPNIGANPKLNEKVFLEKEKKKKHILKKSEFLQSVIFCSFLDSKLTPRNFNEDANKTLARTFIFLWNQNLIVFENCTPGNNFCPDPIEKHFNDELLSLEEPPSTKDTQRQN